MYVRRALAVTALILFLLVPAPALSASAADMSRAVGEISVAYGTPEADGTIGDGEYPAKVTLDSRNMKAVTAISYNVPETHSIDLFFSWDEEYLYVAVDVTDPTAAFSDVDENGNWLFNGDNTQFFADFGPTLSFRELSDTEKLGGRRSSLFASGINSDGSYFLLHQLSENDAIMNLAPDAPPAFGKVTDRGWIFEYAVPFSVLLEDMTDKTGVDLSAENIGNGARINCMLIYNDFSTAGVLGNMFGTTSTGYEDPFDWQPEVFGIYLTLTGGEKTAVPVPSPEGKDTMPPDETESGSASGGSGSEITKPQPPMAADTLSPVTSEAASERGNKGTAAAVVSVVAVCAAAVAIGVAAGIKKKRKK